MKRLGTRQSGRRPPNRRTRRERGVALLLVLWVFALLGVLAFDFGQYMRDDALAAVNLAEETRGYYLAVAAMNRAIFDQVLAKELESHQGEPAEQIDLTDRQPLLPVDAQWHPLELLGGKAEARVTDLASGIPLAVSLDPETDDAAVSNEQALGLLLSETVKNLLRGGNRATGVDKDVETRAAAVSNAILDWLDPDDEVREPGGAEAKYYASLDPPRLPKNGPLDSVEELLLVKGVDADLFYGAPGRPGLRDLVSVFNPNVAVNLQHATAPFLQVLFGIDADEAQDVIAQRSDPDNGWLLYVQRLQQLALAVGKGFEVSDAGVLTVVSADEEDDLGGGQASEGTNEPARVVLVEGRADTSQPRNQSRVAAVVLLDSLDGECEQSFCRSEVSEGITILRWFDRGPWTFDDVRPDAEEEGASG